MDNLEDVIISGWPVPGVNRAMIDLGKATDILEAIRENLPHELEIARDVTSSRDQRIEEAAAEAQQMIADARNQADDMIRGEGVYMTAERQARALLDQAEARAVEVRERADEYALDSLQSLEIRLGQTIATVQNGIATLHGRAKRASVVEEQELDEQDAVAVQS